MDKYVIWDDLNGRVFHDKRFDTLEEAERYYEDSFTDIIEEAVNYYEGPCHADTVKENFFIDKESYFV